MEIELIQFENSHDEQHRPRESIIIWKSSNQQNASEGKQIWKKSTLAYNISKSRYSFILTKIISIYITSFIDRRMFCSFLKSSKINVFAAILFICLVMIVGVLTVCFTLPKPSMCSICYSDR